MARSKRSGAASTDGPTTPATVALDRASAAYGRHVYDHDPAAPAYGPEAAQALGIEPSRVFKTLVVEAPTGLAVGIVPVDAQLDLKAMAKALGAKAVDMADPAAAERSSGYVLGGISPLGQKRVLPTVLDESANDWPTIFVSGGRRGFEIDTAPDTFVRLLKATLAPIARR